MKNITYRKENKTAKIAEAVHTHTHTDDLAKRIINKSITIFLLLIIFIVLNTEKTKAVLQSNGNPGVAYDLSNWMLKTRQMEQLGGAMGLNENINTTGLTFSGDSNNIDVHMQKNTEFGALAILSASSYGNPEKINDDETTTGNATGVVMKINGEWVAAGTVYYATTYADAVQRYKDYYTKSYVAKKGDAITETVNWHGSDRSRWISGDTSVTHGRWQDVAGLVRSISGSIFSYDGYSPMAYGSPVSQNVSYWGKGYYSRAVVVCGQGI